MAHILYNIGVKDAMVVFGQDGLDEISASAPTTICEVRDDGKFRLYEITPERFGLKRCTKEELVGGTPEENAQITRDILSGKERGGAKIYLKREDLNHTGAHKINNVLGQCLLAKKMGKTRVIAETGAGQHGVAAATAAALMGLECEIFMGKKTRTARRSTYTAWNCWEQRCMR